MKMKDHSIVLPKKKKKRKTTRHSIVLWLGCNTTLYTYQTHAKNQREKKPNR